MPTREQKLVSYAAWRVTVPGSGAKLKKVLEDLHGSVTGRTSRGGAVVEVEKMDRNWIVFRFPPQRKYDSVRSLVQTHITGWFHLEPLVDGAYIPCSYEAVPASFLQVAASAPQGAAPAAQVAGSAAPACPQRLPAGFLAVKFHSIEG